MKVGDTITKAHLTKNEYGEYSVDFVLDNLYIEWLEQSYIQEVCLDKNDNIIKITFIPNHSLNNTVPDYIEEFTWSFPYYDDTLLVVDNES